MLHEKICLNFNSRVQSLFSWRPGDMTEPQPSFFSFKFIIENPKMKVRNLYFLH